MTLRKPQGDQPVVGNLLVGFLFVSFPFFVREIRGDTTAMEAGRIEALGKHLLQHSIYFFSWPHLSPLWNNLTTFIHSAFERLCAGSCSKTCLILQYSC